MISFIIPAYNEEGLLGPTLLAVHAAAHAASEPYEVIVVDDASSDRTAAVAESHGARVVSAAHRQIAATRNSGARASRGDLLIFVDADTIVNEAVIRAAVQVARGGAVGGGSAVLFEGRLPRWARWLVPMIVWCFRIARLAAGCFLFCTRPAFEAVGGFDETLYGAEEIAMSQALKRQGRFVILRESVMTSGRKFRAYVWWELLHVFGRLAWRGRRSVRSRQDLGIWYEDRREDPDVTSGGVS